MQNTSPAGLQGKKVAEGETEAVQLPTSDPEQWHMPAVPAPGRLKQKHCHGFEASLSYTVRFSLARATEQDPVSNNKNTNDNSNDMTSILAYQLKHKPEKRRH